MGRFLNLTSLILLSMLAAPSAANQVQQSAQTDALVARATQEFFELMPKANFKAERTFMTNDLANMMPLKKWRSTREAFGDMVGLQTKYRPYRLTYYQQKHLLAAVDFSGKAQKPGMYVCGYVLWEISNEDRIGLSRLEQNVVQANLIQQMDMSEAVQLLTNWRCHNAVIEAVLGVKVQN